MDNNVDNNTSGATQEVVETGKQSISEKGNDIGATNSVIEPATNNVANLVSATEERKVIQQVINNKEINIKPVVKEVEKEPETLTLEEEKPQPVKEEKYGGKVFFLIIFFGLFFGLVIFLPDISKYIETKKYLDTYVEEKITTGVLKCEYEKDSETLDYSYTYEFAFSDNKLNKLTYWSEIRGDAELDEEELNSFNTRCNDLSLAVKELEGISVSCSLSNGLYKQKQIVNYSKVNISNMKSAYTEAGGIYPDYENLEAIENVERRMNAAGYNCEIFK